MRVELPISESPKLNALGTAEMNRPKTNRAPTNYSEQKRPMPYCSLDLLQEKVSES